MKIKDVSKATDPTIFTVQFTRHEVWVILRALATANDATPERGEKTDTDARTWIAQRFLTKLQDLGYLKIDDELARRLMERATGRKAR